MDRELLRTSAILGLVRSALSNASAVEMGTVSGVVAPFAATLKGFGFKQVNIRIITNHGLYYMLERKQRRAAGGGHGGKAVHRRRAPCRASEPSRALLAESAGEGLPEVSYCWGLIYLYLPVLRKESEVGLTCHLQEN